MADDMACKHLVLVHGACIGGWSYFKVAARLRSAGYRVTAPDLGASGVDPRPLREGPALLGSLPPGEKVVLVGHSLGGVNVALAAELFPEKIAVAVFLCAFMPDHTSRPSHVLERFIDEKWLDWMDTEMKPQDAEGKLPTSMLFGPQIAQEKLMQLCSPEDITLAGSLLRVSSMFVEDLQAQPPDLAIPEGYQRWMIGNTPVDEVKEIDADHVVMLSRPDELARCLADIAESYAA
uniref:AB hydrolase-1 domain-containing protein n=1 Tax=Oryza brachyantha TaxID=4533 RepID=J3L4T0_ORYBR